MRIANEILMCFRSVKKTAQDLHINDPIDTDSDGNSLTLGDIIADDVDIVDDVDLKLKTDRLRELLKNTLTSREQKIMYMRYGLCGYTELPQREVARRLHISRSYVSRIEKKAIEKLREGFSEK